MNLPTLRKVQPGDIVRCNVAGRLFFAHAEQLGQRTGEDGLHIDPIPGRGSTVTYRFVTPDQVEEYFVRAGRTAARPRRNRKVQT